MRDDALLRQSWHHIIGGGLMMLVAAGGIAIADATGLGIAALGVVLGAVFLHSGLEVRRHGLALPLYSALLRVITEGKLDVADAMIASASLGRDAREPLVASVLALSRASIAYARGDFAVAAHAASAAIGRAARRDRVWDDVLQLDARSLRVVANAALGESIAEDVRVLYDAEHATPAFLARVELARAIELARANQRTRLARHLDLVARLVLGHGSVRERALLRALRGCLEGHGHTYREWPCAAGEGKVRSWIAKAAPMAAAFAPCEPALYPAPMTNAWTTGEPEADRVRANDILAWRFSAFPSESRRVWPYALVSAALVVYLAVAGLGALGLVLLFAMFVALCGYMHAFRNRNASAIHAALRRRAYDELRRIANRAGPQAASASHHLAVRSNRNGDFAAALAECEVGLASCRTSFDATRLFVLPGLLTESAVALAALGRFEEAERELMTLHVGCPDYAHLATATFRVRLISAMRRGERGTAAAVAATRSPDLALDLETSILADLALGERPVDADLTPEVATWLHRLTSSPYGERHMDVAVLDRPDVMERPGRPRVHVEFRRNTGLQGVS